MKVIDLLNKIAKGEEVPTTIIYNKVNYTFEKLLRTFIYFDDDYTKTFNDEVEIIEEEKEIEKLDLRKKFQNGEYVISVNDEKIQDKINELIDVINELKRDKNV